MTALKKLQKLASFDADLVVTFHKSFTFNGITEKNCYTVADCGKVVYCDNARAVESYLNEQKEMKENGQ